VRVIAQSLLFSLLLGCAAPVSHPEVAWWFDVQLDGHDQPHGKVWLVVNGEGHLITNDPIGGYRIVASADYGQRQIPNNAALACTAWWAGFGEDMYVQVKADHVSIFRREYDETFPAIPPYLLFKTISVN
jgi:hypothetical protein